MTPWLRTLRTCGTLLALAAPALAASPHGTTPPYGTPPVPSVARASRPAPDASRAGSPAGEGRQRPGRRESTPPDESAYEETVPVPVPTAVPDEPGGATALPAAASEPVLRILPLGGGLVLLGLGLGLVLLALRLRVRRT
ncbi:hypothetical protein ACKI1I_02650 [Streptomyces turgidiscabies]|uniref:hypothetical protein n=1 Tax=Streptomyces turgidiscabies TaxID=85558 RepID=UPI0003149879|nr:hypothetical protein [Streptomyces turgidiscabies]MDX3492202.1 hypothetical protein [Streptomyces turgidiscabies]GAQ69507.1 hypothetical protein T45_01232 [Streptomyces turgidiscabies]